MKDNGSCYVGILRLAFDVSKQYQGRLSGTPASSAHRAPVEHDEFADLDVRDRAPDLFDHAGGLMAEQERELVVDAASRYVMSV